LGVVDEVNQLLNAIDQGDTRAAARLLPLVYDELRRLAAAKLAREAPGQTLQPTALVHEAYLRLVGKGDGPAWNSRGHFFAAAAEAMRRILVENARRKDRLKHGGGLARHDVEEVSLAVPEPQEDLLALDEALGLLGEQHPRKAELVKLRYFGGLTGAEAAEVLGISTTTAERDWNYARAWLYQRIAGQDGPASEKRQDRVGESAPERRTEG
jgi:RNA polymerase sigma factor (TIGR02999 family)